MATCRRGDFGGGRVCLLTGDLQNNKLLRTLWEIFIIRTVCFLSQTTLLITPTSQWTSSSNQILLLLPYLSVWRFCCNWIIRVHSSLKIPETLFYIHQEWEKKVGIYWDFSSGCSCLKYCRYLYLWERF